MEAQATERVTSRDVTALLAGLLFQVQEVADDSDAEGIAEDLLSLQDELVVPISSVHTFQSVDGLLLKMGDGGEYHVTVVRSK